MRREGEDKDRPSKVDPFERKRKAAAKGKKKRGDLPRHRVRQILSSNDPDAIADLDLEEEE